MPFIIIRIVWGVWLVGFVLLLLVATSNLIFAPADTQDRFARWFRRVVLAIIWPIALFSADGRRVLRGS